MAQAADDCQDAADEHHVLAGRLVNRVQLTADGRKMYLSAVDDAFGAEVDFAQLVKIYGADAAEGEKRAVCIG